MNEENNGSSLKKSLFIAIAAILIVVGFLFQTFWNTGTTPAQVDRELVEKHKFLQNLVEPEIGTLYSLDPEDKNIQTEFHGFKILGVVKLSPEQVADVALEFKDAADAYTDSMPPATCFNPRAGIRVEKAGKTYDFLISYECLSMRAFTAEGKAIDYGVAGSPENLNQIFQVAGVPVSEKKP